MSLQTATLQDDLTSLCMWSGERELHFQPTIKNATNLLITRKKDSPGRTTSVNRIGC